MYIIFGIFLASLLDRANSLGYTYQTKYFNSKVSAETVYYMLFKNLTILYEAYPFINIINIGIDSMCQIKL